MGDTLLEPAFDMESVEQTIIYRLRNDAPEWTPEHRAHVATHITLALDTLFKFGDCALRERAAADRAKVEALDGVRLHEITGPRTNHEWYCLDCGSYFDHDGCRWNDAIAEVRSLAEFIHRRALNPGTDR